MAAAPPCTEPTLPVELMQHIILLSLPPPTLASHHDRTTQLARLCHLNRAWSPLFHRLLYEHLRMFVLDKHDSLYRSLVQHDNFASVDELSYDVHSIGLEKSWSALPSRAEQHEQQQLAQAILQRCRPSLSRLSIRTVHGWNLQLDNLPGECVRIGY